MAGLLYRPDMDEVRARLTAWWGGADWGRPMLLVSVPAEHPAEDPGLPPALPRPAGWVTDYSTSDYGYRVNIARRACVGRDCLYEQVPVVSPDLAPNCLALFLGCEGVEMPGTVWCEPFLSGENPPVPEFRFDAGNKYWAFSSRLCQELRHWGEGRWMQQFPDLIEGLDTLAAIRGTEELLVDLLERPEWVKACLRQITTLYFDYYDRFYDWIKDETGGSVFWCWAPGRMAKFQCDFSAMISPAMYDEFMMPVMREMTSRVDHCMYHLDGPGAIAHVDLLVSLPDLDMIQWISGSGVENSADKRWWPLLHTIVDAGKKVMIGIHSTDELLALRREFGAKLNRFLIGCSYPMTRAEADGLAALLER